MRLLLIAVLLLSTAFAKNLLSDAILKSKVNNQNINEKEEFEFEIDGSDIQPHSYTIKNDDYFYCFSSDTEKIFYKDKEEEYYIRKE